MGSPNTPRPRPGPARRRALPAVDPPRPGTERSARPHPLGRARGPLFARRRRGRRSTAHLGGDALRRCRPLPRSPPTRRAAPRGAVVARRLHRLFPEVSRRPLPTGYAPAAPSAIPVLSDRLSLTPCRRRQIADRAWRKGGARLRRAPRRFFLKGGREDLPKLAPEADQDGAARLVVGEGGVEYSKVCRCGSLVMLIMSR